jgi:hypothetical protein
MSKVENMAGEEELQHEEARQQEGVHNHPASQLQRRICYSTILPETMVIGYLRSSGADPDPGPF